MSRLPIQFAAHIACISAVSMYSALSICSRLSICSALLIVFTLSPKTALSADVSNRSDLTKIIKDLRAQVDGGQNQEAEKKLRDLVASNPDSDQLRLVHAIALYNLGRFHAAADHLERLSAHEKPQMEVWLYLARTYQSMGKLQKSIDAYNKFLALAPAKLEDRDKYSALISVLQSQITQQSAKEASQSQVGDYIADVTENGLFKWPESVMPISVYISNGESVPGYRDDFDESLRDAFDQWQIKTKDKIRFNIVNDPATAKMKVNWSNDLHSAPLKAEMGHAKLSATSDGIDAVTIELLTVDPFKDGPIGKRLMRNVCLHEVGHALGLQGHSPFPDDIMYPQLGAQDGISARDVNTLLTLYSDSARDRALSATPTIKQNTIKRQANLLASEGSKLAVDGKYDEALKMLGEALKIDPEASTVRLNYAVVANNLAIKEENAARAVDLLHQSLYWQPDNNDTRSNLAVFLQRIKVSPTAYDQRVKLADECVKRNDLVGAVVELREALKLKDDASGKKRLLELEGKLKQRGN